MGTSPQPFSLILMATSVVPQDDFLMAVWSIQVMNGISDEHIVVAVTALWQEATFLAQANKNVAKFLYIGARYMPLLIAVPGLICEHISILYDIFSLTRDCQSIGDLATAFGMIAAFCAESIFVLRTCAMWEVKHLLRQVMFVIVAGITVTGLIMFTFVPGQYVFVPDVPTCKTLQVAKEQRLLVAFLALLTLELILVIFTAIRAVKNYRSTSRPLLTLLLTHHMFYYGCGFLFSIINVLCVALFEYEYAAVLFNPQIMMHAILTTRMHYRLWESEDARRSYRSEQYPMPSLFWQPPEETATS
ncbi:hypothetical protein DFJ58DRAFT_797256 [Suillus subalutaceus]|uniref:uncharacterized protein n=1 Tax=Suillus subalutaceus TaxID=48586 RepID=UPI001B876E7D|nr:uncharacterized protein DFJ58DRAFT_797256 [Suillus subalutaceus]KAG1847648.1 hypothetical protein DFJ58DRAFT_797256 [Suillus subalutaceus]